MEEIRSRGVLHSQTQSTNGNAMNENAFLGFVDQVDWRFAKSVPNWPHFYIVEEELADQEAFRAARSFIRESGRDGKFYDLNVRYYDAGEWTYWSSPLVKPFESQYMLNRCRTEFTYESLAAAGALPEEGFQGSALTLTPVLEDPEFQALVSDTKGIEFTVFDVLDTADYEIRHSNVLSRLTERRLNVLRRHSKMFHSLSFMLEDESVKAQCGDVEFNLLKSILAVQ